MSGRGRAEGAGAPPGASGRARLLAGRRREAWTVAALVVGAVVLRVVYVLQMRASPLFDLPIMDVLYHVEWARALTEGREYHPGPFFRAPLYIWFLSGVFRLFGDGLLWPRLIQAGFGGATTLLVYAVARRAFDRRVAFVAGLAAATYWVLVYFDGELLIETLIVPLDLLALWLALGLVEPESSQRRRAWLSLGAGLALGLSIIARPNPLLFAPLLALWMVWIARPRWRSGLTAAGLFALGVAAPILPITAHNVFVQGEPVLISTQAGVNFWIGNNPRSDGSTAIVPGTRGGWWTGYHDAVAQAEAAEGRPLSSAEVSRHYSRRAWGFLLGQPRESIPLLFWKLRLFWTDWELGNNQSIRFFARRYGPIVRFLPLGFAVLAAFGLFGCIASLRGRATRLFPLWGFLFVYTAGVVAFFVNARFRVPVLPILMVYGAWTLLWLVDHVRRRRLLTAGLSGVVLAGMMLFSKNVPDSVRTDDSNGWWQVGVAEAARGDERAAAESLRRAVEIDPRNVFARTHLAKVLDALGRTEEAIEELTIALGMDWTKVDALDYLLEILVREQRWERAEQIASAAKELAPNLSMPLYWLGRVEAEGRGDWRAARDLFAEAVRLDPRDFEAVYSLGLALETLGASRAALGAYERAASLAHLAPEPFGEEAWRRLLRIAGELGETGRQREWERQFRAWQARRAASPSGV